MEVYRGTMKTDCGAMEAHRDVFEVIREPWGLTMAPWGHHDIVAVHRGDKALADTPQKHRAQLGEFLSKSNFR
jgi:hypothetical protein